MALDSTETIVVRGGTGQLSLRHGRLDTALLLDGEPVALVWEGQGQGRTFVRAQDLGALEDTQPLRHVAPEARLSATLRPILALLPDGPYHLELLASPDVEPDEPDEDARPHASGRFVDWAGLHEIEDGEPLLIGTVPRDLLDPARIRDLTGWIREGGRPGVVVLDCEGDDVGFIVAGHAALEAYRQADRQPTLLRITTLEPAPLTLQEGADLLTRAYEHIGQIVAAHYAATHEDEDRRHA